jgi:hypothetical protein
MQRRYPAQQEVLAGGPAWQRGQPEIYPRLPRPCWSKPGMLSITSMRI